MACNPPRPGSPIVSRSFTSYFRRASAANAYAGGYLRRPDVASVAVTRTGRGRHSVEVVFRTAEAYREDVLRGRRPNYPEADGPTPE